MSIFEQLNLYISILAFFLIIVTGRIRNKKNLYLIFLLIILILFTRFNNNYNIFGAISNSKYIIMSVVLLNTSLEHSLFKKSFYIHFFIFLFYLLIGTNPNQIFLNSSRNYISVIIINQLVLYYISKKDKNNINVLPAVLTLILSFWAVGRSGILSSGLLLVAFLFNQKNNYRKLQLSKIIKTFLIMSGLCLSVIFIFNYSSQFFSSFINAVTKLESITISDDPRGDIIEQYITQAQEGRAWLVGVNLNQLPVLYKYNFNLHNSFLKLHAYFGLPGLILITFLSLRYISSEFFKKNYVNIIMITAVFIRIFTDIIAFSGVFDPIIFYFILNEVDLKKETKKRIYIQR